jgi:D-alanyl-lipoteichoic acid acyltransferase DltB (MBOAT superfamily)
MQPAVPIRSLDFWLPTTSIALTVWVWSVTRPAGAGHDRLNLAAAALVAGIPLAVALTRYLEPICCLTPTRPPGFLAVIFAAALAGSAAALANIFTKQNRTLVSLTILAILVLFVALKSEPLAQGASAGLRRLNGQDPALASFLDLRWLGFSYLAFRLLHVLRDAQSGKLPSFSLGDFVTYALFFPAYTAGPIDRSQRFIPDLCSPKPAEQLTAGRVEGARRILVGVFKKFVLADTLALAALNSQNAAQTASTAWTWMLLYAFTLRIYFDFSGYTDIALGLGRLTGITLPENFTTPYRKTNLTAFWNSWHITLAQWFRAYFFNPFTRWLRSPPRQIPTPVVILAGQVLTMLLIGLWHGITPNFAAWGLWHGAGLFAHNRWSEWRRAHPPSWSGSPAAQRLLPLGGWLLTFHYVALGWVWFALPNLEMSLDVFRKLFGG